MKKTIFGVLAVLFGLAAAVPSFAVKVGDPAPGFDVKDTHGQALRLSDLKGKYVVLEWHNPSCPFVVSQYKGKMQKVQAKWVKKGVVWISVISSAPGTEGYEDAAKADLDVKTHHSRVTSTVLDPDGTLGHAYGAKSTPHMFVIGPNGTLIYNGAIDNEPLVDQPASKTEDGQPFVNYVDRALSEAQAKGGQVTVPSTVPYGCHVKYKE